MRRPRQDFPGARHHVFNRGRRREPMFDHVDACELFLDRLVQLDHRFGVRVHGYALMPNHYHLLLESDYGPISPAMQWLVSGFVQQLNERRGWDGAVFQGRFRNRLADSDAYWMHLLAYVHLNPLRAGLAERTESSWWTSHAHYVAPEGPGWLHRETLLEAFGGVVGYLDYLEAVQDDRRKAPEGFTRLARPDLAPEP